MPGSPGVPEGEGIGPVEKLEMVGIPVDVGRPLLGYTVINTVLVTVTGGPGGLEFSGEAVG